jgi:hypothetical protein
VTDQNQTKQNLEQDLEKKIKSINLQSEEEKAQLKASDLGLPYVNLKAVPVDLGSLYLVNEIDAHSGQLAVVSRLGQKLKVAILDPDASSAKEVISKLTENGFSVDILVVSQTSLNIAWRGYALKKDSQTSYGFVQLKESEMTGDRKSVV